MLYLEAFLKLEQSRGKSPQTLEAYQRDLLVFMQVLLSLSSEISDSQKAELEAMPFDQAWSFVQRYQHWQKLTREDVQNFVVYRMQAGIAARSIARQLSAIRMFFDFLIEKGVLASNPAKLVKAPKQPKPLPKSLDVDWTKRLLEQPLETWQDVRDQAIFELLYSAGLRVSECTELDLNPGLNGFASGWVRVLGKGQKERLAPVGSKALAAMQAWLKIRGEHADAEEQAVFVNQRGGRLSVRSVQKNLDKRSQLAGLPTKMSPHRLRHACATHVLESSGDLRAVQEILGHANLSTTQIYTRLDLQHLAQVYDKAHPRAKKSLVGASAVKQDS